MGPENREYYDFTFGVIDSMYRGTYFVQYSQDDGLAVKGMVPLVF